MQAIFPDNNAINKEINKKGILQKNLCNMNAYVGY